MYGHMYNCHCKCVRPSCMLIPFISETVAVAYGRAHVNYCKGTLSLFVPVSTFLSTLQPQYHLISLVFIRNVEDVIFSENISFQI